MPKRINLPLVSIIIVNWNGGLVFERCLKSLSKLKYLNWELIVVDNGSNDKSYLLPKKFKLHHKSYRLIRNIDNKGFAEANNQGLRFVKGKYILLLNNDTEVSEDLLNILVEKLESDASLGVIQPKIRMMDNVNYLDNAGSFMTRTGFLEHWGFGRKDSKEFSKEKYVFSAKGACLFTRSDIVEKIGLFDDSYVSYFEESDFCYRVWLSGWKVMYFPKTEILHKVGFTSSKLPPVEVNFHSMKNRINSYIKNLSIKNYFLILVPHLLCILLLGFYYLLRFQYGKFKMIFNSVYWNIKNLRTTLADRKRIQEMRTVGDNEIFALTMHKTNWHVLLSHFIHSEKNFKNINSFPPDVLEVGRVRVCLEKVNSEKINSMTVVNVGCSFGWMENKLENKVKEIIGIDPFKKAIEYATEKNKSERVKFMVGNAELIPVKNESADLVTLFDVIEHVPKGRELNSLLEIKRVLKNNGLLLLSTPNNNLITNFLDPAWYLGHRHYSVSFLENILLKSGFEVIEIDIRGNFWFSFYLLWLYFSKWILRINFPRNIYLEKLDDKGFIGSGYHTIFIKARKSNLI